jgi:hypothetical protein
MKYIITEKQDKEIRSFMRRLNIVDDFISDINPKDVCKYWNNTDRDALFFADDIIVGAVWVVNRTLGINSYENKKLYKFLEDAGYYDILIKIFHNSFELCE